MAEINIYAELPSYVLKDEFMKEDLIRVKNIVGTIENLLKEVKSFNDMVGSLSITDEDLALFKKLYSERNEDIFSLAKLFINYWSMATYSGNKTIETISKLFKEDLKVIYRLLPEIANNSINSMTYLDYLTQLIQPYRVVIEGFIYLTQCVVVKHNQHFSDTENNDVEFDKLWKELASD